MSPVKYILTVLTPHSEATVLFKPGENLREILLSGGFMVRSACGGNGACGRCQVRVPEGNANSITDVERLRLSGEQLRNAVRLACQIFPSTDMHVTVVQPVEQMYWRFLREDEYGSLAAPVSLHEPAPCYGVAIDLGTTHIRLTLWDLAGGKRVAGRTGLNPQGSYGTDVLTRIDEASRSSEIAQKLSSMVQRVIAEALRDIAIQFRLNLSDVQKVCIVGNTAMLSLLACKNFTKLLSPENWTGPIDCQPADTGFLRDAWAVSKDAQIRFIAPLGGFIGSDLLAGLVATKLAEGEAGSLLIDFGTNSEIALWDGVNVHVTSAAGGPAFEGCGISCGMPCESGAIYRVDQIENNGFGIRVSGDDEAAGLCGSGLVDAVAWLRRNGRLDRLGRFTRGDDQRFVIHAGRNQIVLMPRDIDVLQRAKAAIGGGVLWLCRQAGLPINELRKIYVCGAFGRLLDIGNAQQIGLLPNISPSAICLEGNSALAGCETMLVSMEAGKNLHALSALCRVYNLAEEAGYESLFVENLFLQPIEEPM